MGLAGCRMGLKIEAECGIREILRAGHGLKMTWRDRDALISIGGMRDSFEIDVGLRDLTASDLLKIYMVATGQEMVRGKKNSSRSGKCQGILFWVRENWHFEEKSGKIEIVTLI